ncbi:gliding motility-associated C-terminal domain-containing protein [Hymenobacter rubidus]|uniref:gliding motility-associated C-terminal domain-containing protein n=1 Tax=Hymenobacter rubidus TaxID=1441626 RepID=UPI00191D2E4B|nr:gliding motility-associated C-terminal domain-containing protein [Hymenobacter rubidus]
MAIAPSQAAGSTSVVQATVADSSGHNLYLVGYFFGTVGFGASTLTSAGDADAFVAKWNIATQAFVWARRAGGSRSDGAGQVVVKGSSVYIAGSFLGSAATFGAIKLNAAVSNSGYPADIYVAKLTDAGATADFVWAVRAGGEAEDFIGGLAVRGSSVYVSGAFASRTADFGSTVLVNANSSNDFTDMFLARITDYGPLAAFDWAQRVGGPRHEGAGTIAVSGTSLYLSGTFTGPTLTFGSTTLSKAAGSDIYSTDAFVTKFVDTGPGASAVWAQSFGGPGNDNIAGPLLDGSTLYIAGQFSQTATVGSTALTSAGGSDVYVARLTDTGASSRFDWATRAGGTGQEDLYGLALSGSALYLTGDFFGATTRFGTATLANATTDIDERYCDLFVAKLTDASTGPAFAWAQRAGGTNYDFGTGVAVVGPVVYVAGGATPALSFGTHPLAGPVGARIAYLASLADVPTPADPGGNPDPGSGPDAGVGPGDCTQPGGADACPIQIPNIITPNGDGPNDRFVCHGLPAGDWELTVYNRWGRLVYQQAAYRNTWDAAGQPAGLFYYLLRNPASGARYRGWLEVVR